MERLKRYMKFVDRMTASRKHTLPGFGLELALAGSFMAVGAGNLLLLFR